jgi:rod shape-determining protein MreB and related proteins
MRTGGELAIDLGTANTLVFRMGEGIVLNQPTVVAVNARNGEVLALGDEAWEMVGQASSRTVAVRPLRRGAITEYETTRQMIRLILKQVGVTRWSKPRALVCIPSAVSEVERRAVEEATRSAGARSVTLIEEPMAAAIGAGLPTHEPIGSFVVDVGGGTTEVAMVSMGGLIARRAVRVGGFDMDAAIQQHVRKEYGLAIGDRAAEQVKITAGAAYPLTDAPAAEIRGREILTGMPKSARLSQEEIREAIADPVAAVVATARECLADSPPELGHDVLERGMFLCGGGGLLRGLDMRISQECEVPVHLTDHPLETVVLGAGRCLELLPEAAGLFAAWRGTH